MIALSGTYLARGDESSLPAMRSFLREQGIEHDANPDVYIRVYPHFGIDEARELTARAASKAVGDRRVFVVVFSAITNEAQNALLKTLEEPPGGSLFFLLAPAPDTLLPTLRSRAQTLALQGAAQGTLDAGEFLKARPRERLDMLKPLLEKNDDDRRDIGAIITFLSSLERILAQRPQAREGIDALYRARLYAGDKGSLLKPLLEQVALLCPSF